MTNIVQFPALPREKDGEADVVAGLNRMIKDLETMATRINVGLINGSLHGDDLGAARKMRDQFTPVIGELKTIAWDPKWTDFSDKATVRHNDLIKLIQRAEGTVIVQPQVRFRANASQEYRDGYHARMIGTPRGLNPYACRDPRNARWQSGWWKADAEPSAPNVVYPSPPETTADDWIKIALGITAFFVIALIGATMN